MAKVSELKERARALEQEGEFAKAQAIYEHILKHLEGTPALNAEVPLYVKVGDLQLKQGDADQAVVSYQRAAEIYARAGSAKSITALVEKIRRADPTRDDVAIPLGQALLEEGHWTAAATVIARYAGRIERSDVVELLAGVEGQPDAAARSLVESALTELVGVASRNAESVPAPPLESGRESEPEPEAEPELEPEPEPEIEDEPAAVAPTPPRRPSPLGQSMTDVLSPNLSDADVAGEEPPQASSPEREVIEDGLMLERGGAEALEVESGTPAEPASDLPLLSFEEAVSGAASELAPEAPVEGAADVPSTAPAAQANEPEPEPEPVEEALDRVRALSAREKADSLVEEAIAASLRADHDQAFARDEAPPPPPVEPEVRPSDDRPHVLVTEPRRSRSRGPALGLVGGAAAVVAVGAAAWFLGWLPFGGGGSGGDDGSPTATATAPTGAPQPGVSDTAGDSLTAGGDSLAVPIDSAVQAGDTTSFGPIGFNAVVDSGQAATSPPPDSVPVPVLPTDSSTPPAPDTAPPVTPLPAVVVPPGHAITEEIVIVRGLPVLSVAETSAGIRVTQAADSVDLVVVAASSPTGGVGNSVVDIVVRTQGDTAVGTARLGAYRIEARAPMAPDRLEQLLTRLIRARPLN